MKTFTHLLCVLILSIVLFACNNAHFLKEESYRNQVAQDFEQKKQALPHGDLFAIFADSMRKCKKCHGKPQGLWTYGSGAEYYFQA